MRAQLIRPTAFILIFVTVVAVGSAEPVGPYTRLRAVYADRFTPRGSYISWSAPTRVPELIPYSSVITYGVVEREAYRLESVLGSLERSVYEIRVIDFLKKPDGAPRDHVLVSQVTEEAWNPALQPGDVCVLFLHLSEHDAPGSEPLYYLSGSNSRYVVYGGKVYSINSLNPRILVAEYRQESLIEFMDRIRSYVIV